MLPGDGAQLFETRAIQPRVDRSEKRNVMQEAVKSAVQKLGIDVEKMRVDARAVLARNTQQGEIEVDGVRVPWGRYTAPGGHYPHLWAWDSAFIAMGYAAVDPDRAIEELETLMKGQWKDGRVPHIHFLKDGDYVPGPTFWHGANAPGPCPSSSITNPPIWISAARQLYARAKDRPEIRERIRALLPAFERSLQFFSDARDPLKIGACATVHPWEPGRDNAIEWKPALDRLSDLTPPAYERRDNKLVDPNQRPTQEFYDACFVLLDDIKKTGFGPGDHMAVYDPGMTALRIAAEDDMRFLAKELGVESRAGERAAAARRGLSMLWSEKEGRFGFYDVKAGKLRTPDTIGAYLPLVVDGLTEKDRLIRGLKKNFDTPYPLPTLSPKESAFSDRCYWLGPAWVNMNFLLAPHLEAELPIVERTLELIQKHGFCEYYNPFTGEPYGATGSFGWTAALVLDWLSLVGEEEKSDRKA
jgi:glycogen debranching enzyme